MKKKKLFFYTLLGTLLLVWVTESFAFGSYEIINKEAYKRVLSTIDISSKDIKNYKNAFKLIRDGRFDKLDENVKDIDNDILMGYVLAEKYLSKTYKSSFGELKTWLEKYSDHPQTGAIYRLALQKKADKDVMPVFSNTTAAKKYYSPYSWYNELYEETRPKYAKYLRQKIVEFRRHINQGKTRRARMILEDATFRQRIPNRSYDAMSATLAMVYLLDNEDKMALQWVEKAVRRSNDATASWVGGLAAWRLKQYKTSANYFSKLGAQKDNDEWLIAAGAYWAYRVYDRLGNNIEAQKWLITASRYDITFHGILANYKLGRPANYEWELTSHYNDFVDNSYIDEMLASESIRRALILIYAKNPALAEKELKHGYKNMTQKQKEIALYVSQQYDLHFTMIDISNKLRMEGARYDLLAYPAPDWKPKGGWKVDRALAWALVRQESAFSPLARSSAGALGLMQLMPNTAYHITKKRDNESLLDVSHNLDVGQRYVNYLLEKPFVDGNLFFLAVAYNAGPGNLVKWQKRMKYGDDPLLFIEVVPARETRLYIKRVMANYWIYNIQFGRSNPTLEQVSEGKWPKSSK